MNTRNLSWLKYIALTIISSVLVLLFTSKIFAQNVVVTDDANYSPHASAMLDVKSTTKGLLIPRVSSTGDVSSPATGLLVYQTGGTAGFYYYNGSTWVLLFAGTIEINDLTDGISDGSSVFLGTNTGAADDGANLNVGLGTNALKLNSSGQGNVAIGFDALYNNTNHLNIGIGYQSLKYNTSGDYNIGLGSGTNYYNQTGSNNVVIGYEAGYGSTTHNKSGSVLLGYQAGYSDHNSNRLYIENSNSSTPLIYGEFDNNFLKFNGTLELANGSSASSLKFYEPSGSGTNYTLFRSQAQSGDVTYTLPAAGGSSGQVLQTNGYGLLSWQDDIGATYLGQLADAISSSALCFIGYNSGTNNSGSTYSSGLGVYSLYQNTTGNRNTAIGYETMKNNTTGNYNTAVGSSALEENVQNSRSTAIGYGSMKYADDQTSGRNTYNTAVGYLSLRGSLTASNNTGQYNTAIGDASLQDITSGSNNTALGANSLTNNTTGSYNISLGTESLINNISGEENLAIGYQSLYSNNANSRSTAVGYKAMYFADNTSSGRETFNTAIGYEALLGSSTASNDTGRYNTVIGDRTLYKNTKGSQNTAIGFNASYKNNEGSFNTAIGSRSNYNGTTGNNNVSLGYYSLYNNTVGSDNVVIGNNAAQENYGGSYNTIVGSNSCNKGYGSKNTIIGYMAGYTNSTHSGSSNVFIGYEAGKYSNENNKLRIDNEGSTNPLIYGDFSSQYVVTGVNLFVGGLGYFDYFGNGAGIIALVDQTAPNSSITNGVLLYAESIVQAELKVRDEAGNVTTLSPHNFSLIKKTEPMAWSFYSENSNIGQVINIDMLKVVREVEKLSGEKLVVLQDLETGEEIENNNFQNSEIEKLKNENLNQQILIEELLKRIEKLENK